MGRFVSPDSSEILLVSPMEQTDKKLYAYCDNNPVSRKDVGGGFWHVVIGAAIGAAISFTISIASDVVAGNNIDWTGAAISAGIGAVEGALTAAGVPVGVIVAVSAVAGAGESVYKDIKDGNSSVSSIVINATISAGVAALFSATGTPAEGQRMNKEYRAAKEAWLALKAGGLHPSMKKTYQKTLSIYLKSLKNFAEDSLIDGFVSSISKDFCNKLHQYYLQYSIV